jgi:hypothetical protein
VRGSVTRKLIGSIGVDSGQMMVGDPCYLHEWKPEEYITGKELQPDKDGKYPYTYPGACSSTQSKDQGGILGRNYCGLSAVCSTGYGDGEYPVYLEYSDEGTWGKRVKRLIVEFIGDKEDAEE